jgi:hypothetical protein
MLRRVLIQTQSMHTEDAGFFSRALSAAQYVFVLTICSALGTIGMAGAL